MDLRLMEPEVDYESTVLKYEIHSDLNNCTCRIIHDDVNMFNAVVIIGFLPFLSMIGLIFNAINMYVYSKTHSSAERYLMALSISDFGVCASGILVITADSLRAHSFFVDQVFTLLLPKLIPFGLFFQMASIYVTVTAAVDCYIKVSRCFESRHYCTVKNANRILICTFFLTALYNVIQFGELEAVQCFAPDLNKEIYELCPTALRLNESYIAIYRGYMYAIVMAFFPFIVLTILTALILYELRRRKTCKILNRSVPVETFHDYVVISDQPELNKPIEADSSSPMVLVLVVVLFLSCSFVSLLVNICDMFEGALTHEVQMALIDVGNILVVFNATANFLIYMSSSSYFRNQVIELFGWHKHFQKIQKTTHL